MNKTVFYIVFCWLSLPLFAQTVSESENLVPNGSFEEYEDCPLGIADFSVSEWYSPTWGTPDYYNVCNNNLSNDVGIPINFNGNQHPKDGNAYAGIVISYNDENEAREYIQVELNRLLKNNKIYEFTCYINKAKLSSVCTSNLGFLFTKEPVGGNINQILLTPQYTNNNPNLMCDEENWNIISFVLQPKGGEKYLTIGFFDSNNILDTTVIKYSNMGFQSYYYIDKVFLKELDIYIPNIFTPNGDGINDLLTISGVPNDYNLLILNRWGNVVFQTNKPSSVFWDGTYRGEQCSDGVYFYKLKKDYSIKNGVIHLIR